MPLNLTNEDIELLWLIQPNLANNELDIKMKFKKTALTMDVNDVMYITISSDFDYIYKLNPSSSSYRGNSTFFVFKVNSNSQTSQDYLVLKLNEDIETTKLNSFMSFLMDYTDLLDLESSSLKNETLRKIFHQFERKETCIFNKNVATNRQDVLNSLDFHHDVFIDKEKAEMINNGAQAIGNGIVSLSQMASTMIETIGTQISTNCEKANNQQMDTNSPVSSITSCSDESFDEQEGAKEMHTNELVNKETEKKVNKELEQSAFKDKNDEKDSQKKKNSKKHHRHHRHSRRHRTDHPNEDNDEERAERREARRHRRRSRRAANLRMLNQFSKSFAETATIAATAISSAITETASYVVPAVEEYLPGIISSVTNYDEQTSRKMVGSTLGYGKVALNAVNEIKNSVQEGVGMIGTSVVNQTTQVVKAKFGEETAEETLDALNTVENVAKTYTTIKKIV